MREAVKAVLFDMDGVLVFSEEAWFLVYNDTLQHFGHAPVPRPEFNAIYGNGTKADRDMYMPERSIEEVDEAYARFFQLHLDAVYPNPEAVQVLRELRARGIKTAAATNTQHRLARRILDSEGLLAHLDEVACADEAGAGKPDPAVLYLASKRLGLPLTDSVFVGDSRYDLEAARRAPVAFHPFRFGEEGRIDSLRELLVEKDR